MEVYGTRDSLGAFLYEVRFIILFYVFGDWASTVYALPLGKESNPIPAMILENYGIYHLLFIKFAFILLLFYAAPLLKVSARKWVITKHTIESVGILVTVNNLMVVWNGSSLIQVLGLI